MVIICNQFKNVLSLVNNISHVTRNYATLRKLPVTWERPKKISCVSQEKSGDSGLNLDISKDDYIDNFDLSSKLENASDIVKKMFTVEFNPRKELVAIRKKKAIELVKRHDYDEESSEVNVAKMTIQILNMQERQFMKEFQRDKKSKVILKELIEKRKKVLKNLRRKDYPCFEYVLEKLNLIYKPFPEIDTYIFRKACTKKLLQKYCDELVEKKLDTYKKKLESQQKDFFKEKAEKLQLIRDEEIFFGLNPTVSEEEIEAAKQKAASFT